jgi:hypothetical protein
MMMIYRPFLSLLIVASTVGAFTATTPIRLGSLHSRHSSTTSSTTTSLNDLPLVDALNAVEYIPLEAEYARGQFYFWFFGASGAASIARSAFPGMFGRIRNIWDLKGVGPTKGGELLGISPLAGYPEDLRVADVEDIANNPLTVTEIVEGYSEGSTAFLAAKGYLLYDAFCKANTKSNPLAVRAVFDTFATSTDAVEPDKAQKLLDDYKQDASKIKGKLVLSKIAGWAAIITLLLLLGGADIAAAYHAYLGWFPEWPGGKNFPGCILDLETGPWTIPKYWI